MNKPYINIGASKEAITEARASIMRIIESKNSNEVKLAAVTAFSEICRVGNVSLSNINLSQHPKNRK